MDPHRRQNNPAQNQPLHSVVFNQHEAVPRNQGPADGLQFYPSNFSTHPNHFSNAIPSSSLNQGPKLMLYTQDNMPWWSAFGTGGIPGELPLFEELGVNFLHIRSKTVAVLNPLTIVDKHIMDDTDLAGPLLFCLLFGAFLLLSGKVQFGYIYGVAMVGWFSIYLILNLMSENGIDVYKTASVLGYCLLPMVILSSFSILLRLRGLFGYLLGILSIFWCTYSSSTIFVIVLGMKDQRFLVAYPVGLLYACFALLTIF